MLRRKFVGHSLNNDGHGVKILRMTRIVDETEKAVLPSRNY